MSKYSKIVVAVELNEQCDRAILDKAKSVAQEGAEIYIIHAVEHLTSYGAAYGISAGVDVEEMLLKEAKKQIKTLASDYAIDDEHQVVKVGPAKFMILDEVQEIGGDLIVLGSHGRHGVRLLLGSTANAVLHGAECDVLAVRVKD